jgi:hypothetical protein
MRFVFSENTWEAPAAWTDGLNRDSQDYFFKIMRIIFIMQIMVQTKLFALKGRIAKAQGEALGFGSTPQFSALKGRIMK